MIATLLSSHPSTIPMPAGRRLTGSHARPRDKKRSWRGFNLLMDKDYQVFLTLARGRVVYQRLQGP